jgi:hypothetical protein
MTYQHGVTAVSAELTVGFVDELEPIKYFTRFEIQGLGEACALRAYYADTVVKGMLRHRH